MRSFCKANLGTKTPGATGKKSLLLQKKLLVDEIGNGISSEWELRIEDRGLSSIKKRFPKFYILLLEKVVVV